MCVSQPLSGIDDKEEKYSRSRFQKHHTQSSRFTKFQDEQNCNLGMGRHPWLQNSYPESVRGIVRGIAFWAVLALVYLVKDLDATQTISTEFALTLLSTVFGFMLGDTIALVTTNLHASTHTGNPVTTGQNASPQDESTPSQDSGENSTKFENRNLRTAPTTQHPRMMTWRTAPMTQITNSPPKARLKPCITNSQTSSRAEDRKNTTDIKLEHFPTAAWRSPSELTIASQPWRGHDATRSEMMFSACCSLPSQETWNTGVTGLSWSEWRG